MEHFQAQTPEIRVFLKALKARVMTPGEMCVERVKVSFAVYKMGF